MKKIFKKISLSFITAVFVSSSVISIIAPSALALDCLKDENRHYCETNDILNYNAGCTTDNNTQAASTGISVPSYKNAIIKDGDHPDPGVMIGEDGMLHMYTSGLRHFTSKDGVNWEGGKEANISGAPGGAGAPSWAPDIAKVGSNYVLSWANPNGGLFYATGASAGGPFKYQGKLTNEGIDPQLFSNGGQTYLYYADSNNIMVASISTSGDKLNAGKAKSILNRLDVKNEKWTVEAPWVVNHGGIYYLYYSTGKWDGGAGNDRDNYDLRVAKSSAPDKQFSREGKPILTKNANFTGPGTATTFSDTSGQEWLIYHARPGGGNDRKPMLDKITYDDGNWPIINGGQGPSTTTQPGSGPTTGTNSSTGATGSTVRVGSYNAAGVTMLKGKLGGLKAAQDHFNAGFNVENANNATIVTMQEVAKNIQPPSGWSMHRVDFGQRSAAIAWKSDVWTLKSKTEFTVDNSKEPGNTPDLYHYPIVQLADKNGQTVSVISAHLVSTIRHSTQQPEQARAVQAKVEELAGGGQNVILGGDFNYKPPDLYKNITLATANPDKGNKSIDQIFGSNGATFGNYKTVGNTSSFTDHALIFSDVSFSGQSFSTKNSICACPSGDVSTSSTTLRGKNNLEKVYNYFIDKGFSSVQAAGIVGNIAHESGGYPARKQGESADKEFKDPSNITNGYGLIQWTPGSKVIGYAKAAGATGPIYELSTQLDILWGHLNNKPPITKGNFSISDYKNIDDVEKATDYFEDKIEAAGSPAMSSRYASAKLALKAYGDKSSDSTSLMQNVAVSSSDTSNGCGSSDGNGAVAGDIVKTAINYAWPNRNVSPQTKAKPVYLAAIKKAKEKGKYTGDACFGGGVDCGAFVTRVMQDSGADPNYGGGGNTAVQLAYVLKHPDMYKEIKPSSTKDLQPGDIALQNNSERHHTYMYVGKQDGFDSVIASASQCEHAPWAGLDKPADPGFRWFRFIGNGEKTVDV